VSLVWWFSCNASLAGTCACVIQHGRPLVAELGSHDKRFAIAKPPALAKTIVGGCQCSALEARPGVWKQTLVQGNLRGIGRAEMKRASFRPRLHDYRKGGDFLRAPLRGAWSAFTGSGSHSGSWNIERCPVLRPALDRLIAPLTVMGGSVDWPCGRDLSEGGGLWHWACGWALQRRVLPHPDQQHAYLPDWASRRDLDGARLRLVGVCLTSARANKPGWATPAASRSSG